MNQKNSIIAYILPDQSLDIDLRLIETMDAFSYNIEFRPEKSNTIHFQECIKQNQKHQYSILIPSQVLKIPTIIQSTLIKYLLFFSETITVEHSQKAKKQIDRIFNENWAINLHWKKGQNYYKCHTSSVKSLITSYDIQFLYSCPNQVDQISIFYVKIQNAFYFYQSEPQLYERLISRIPYKICIKLQKQYQAQFLKNPPNSQRMIQANKIEIINQSDSEIDTYSLINLTHKQIYSQIHNDYIVNYLQNFENIECSKSLESMIQLYTSIIDVFCETTKQDKKVFSVAVLLIESIFENLGSDFIHQLRNPRKVGKSKSQYAFSKQLGKISRKVKIKIREYEDQKQCLFHKMMEKQKQISDMERQNTQWKEKYQEIEQKLMQSTTRIKDQQKQMEERQKKERKIPKSSISSIVRICEKDKKKKQKNVKQQFESKKQNIIEQKNSHHEKKFNNFTKYKSHKHLSQTSLKPFNLLKSGYLKSKVEQKVEKTKDSFENIQRIEKNTEKIQNGKEKISQKSDKSLMSIRK